MRIPILRLLAAPHCDDFSVEAMTDVVVGAAVEQQQQKQQRNRFSQSLELRSLQHENESRSTALPPNPCCGGTAPSPETLMSYLRGNRWTYRNLTLVAARTSFRGVVAARERQGFTMLFFGKDCAVLVLDMKTFHEKQNQVGFEIPFQTPSQSQKLTTRLSYDLQFGLKPWMTVCMWNRS